MVNYHCSVGFGPELPRCSRDSRLYQTTMSDIDSLQIRDLIAMMLLYQSNAWQLDNNAVDWLPRYCYEMADSMMEARKK